MKLSYLVKGFPGHPLHPPFTDVTIGAYTVATVLAVVNTAGIVERNAVKGWWLALIVGLIFTVPSVLTGLLEWLGLTWGSELWKTATLHALTMATATVLFGLAAIFGHGPYTRGDITTGPLVLTLAGWCVLTLGGWLGGSVVFVHGMRVLRLVEEPTKRAITPGPHPEKEMAEGG